MKSTLFLMVVAAVVAYAMTIGLNPGFCIGLEPGFIIALKRRNPSFFLLLPSEEERKRR